MKSVVGKKMSVSKSEPNGVLYIDATSSFVLARRDCRMVHTLCFTFENVLIGPSLKNPDFHSPKRKSMNAIITAMSKIDIQLVEIFPGLKSFEFADRRSQFLYKLRFPAT